MRTATVRSIRVHRTVSPASSRVACRADAEAALRCSTVSGSTRGKRTPGITSAQRVLRPAREVVVLATVSLTQCRQDLLLDQTQAGTVMVPFVTQLDYRCGGRFRRHHSTIRRSRAGRQVACIRPCTDLSRLFRAWRSLGKAEDAGLVSVEAHDLRSGPPAAFTASTTCFPPTVAIAGMVMRFLDGAGALDGARHPAAPVTDGTPGLVAACPRSPDFVRYP